jgi:hypothetical protein
MSLGMHTLLSVALGALGGFFYQRVIGCRSGACAITANPYVATLYGAMVGFLLSGTTR